LEVSGQLHAPAADDGVDFKNVGESASAESSCEISGSESESDTSAVRNDRWEDMSVGDKKPKAYKFTKNVGPQFNLLPHAEPMDYFSLFFNDELLNNTVIETNRYARQKISGLQLSQRSIWNRWSDVSVPKMKAF
jgi:hypothetical protein